MTEKKTNRRDFLKGRSAREAAEDLADRVYDAGTSSEMTADDMPRASYVLQFSRRAMACEFEVLLNAGQHDGAEDAALRCLDRVAEFDDQLSVYKPDSEISRINQVAAARACEVDADLFALLVQCGQLHEATHGAFDVTSSPLSNVWGFSRREGRVPEDAEIADARELVGFEKMELDEAAQTVRFLRDGMHINLGSIGKGYALRRAAELLDRAEVQDYLVHGGFSSIQARGTRLGEADQRGWWIALRHPLVPEKRLGQIRLHNRALATSGSANQFFHHRGKRYGHVIDPRTGQPVLGVLSATVLADDAAVADALATACFVMGPDGVHEFCSNWPEPLGVVLVLPTGKQQGIRCELIGVEADDWQVADSATSTS